MTSPILLGKRPPNRFMECKALFDGLPGDDAPLILKQRVRKSLDRAMKKRGIVIDESTRQEALGFIPGRGCVYGMRVGGWRR